MRKSIVSMRLSLMLLALIAGAGLPWSANAQSGNRNEGPPIPGSPKPGDELRPLSIRERQFKMMELEKEASQPMSPEEREIAAAQIADDYKQIQMVNNKMMAATMRASSPNFSQITQSLGEVRKRAIRLKENLGLAKLELPKKDKAERKQATNAAEIKTQLLTLDGFIMSFVKNPIFTNPDVVNVEEATKARRDLELIIENSQMIAKDAERLNKDAVKAP